MVRDLITTLASYVPALVVRRLAIDSSPLTEPTAERFAAAVLFADITEFTSLADRLSQISPHGSEEVVEVLNNYFGRLIDIIHAHGGEVTKFAGDGLLALWPSPPATARFGSAARQTLMENTLRATLCGQAIRDAFFDYAVAGGLKLKVQVGIGAGDISSVHLGGVFNRWEFLLSGSPLVQMSLAKEKARPGHTVLSPEVWELLGHLCQGHPLAEGFVQLDQVIDELLPEPGNLPEILPGADSGLRSYIPAAVLTHLESGYDEWLSEIRRVTVLFIKLPRYGTSIKHPYMRTLPQAQAVMQTMQRALYRYAGSINKFNVDDKGITLVAAMGLPPLSHSDDTARAIHAALEMQHDLERLGRESAIGITTGWVFCGPIGNELRREYTMVGNAVNMAARLMQAAEAQMTQKRMVSNTLCDKATYETVRGQAEQGRNLAGQLSFGRLQELGIKGFTSPITVYKPLKRPHVAINIGRESATTDSMIGLGTERESLLKNLEELKLGRPRKSGTIVIIEAEAGSGKSLLIRDLKSAADAINLPVLQGSGNALEQMTPFYAWQPIFRDVFGLSNTLTERSLMRSRVLGQLPPIRGERGYPAMAIRLSPLLNDVLSLDFPENRTTVKMSVSQRHRITIMFLLRLLQRKVSGVGGRAAQPTLLIIDNGQWLDDASWDLLLAISKHVEPLLIVVATRPLRERALGSDLPVSCHQLMDSPFVDWIRLPLLNVEQMSAVAARRLGGRSVSDALKKLLWQKTGGQPYFTGVLVSDWYHRGLIKVDKDRRLTVRDGVDLEGAPLLDEIYHAVTARLERLAPRHQLIIKVASVLRQPFSLDALYQVYPMADEKEKLSAELKALEEVGLIQQSGLSPYFDYTFKYGLIREVAYSLLPHAQRNKLKLRITG